jgi:hypothetical protein
MSAIENLDITAWPRVTQILQATGISDFSKIKNSEFYLERGSDVHLICQDIDKGVPDWWSDTDLAGYAQSYINFKAETGFIPDLIEHPVYHDIRKYKGTLDRTGRFAAFKGPNVVDIKSGIVAEWTALQTAGYTGCLTEPETYRRWGLSLSKTGKYKLTEFKNYRSDINYFYSLVATVHGRSIYGKAEDWEGE